MKSNPFDSEEGSAKNFSIKISFADVLMSKKDFERALYFYEQGLEIKPFDIKCRLAQSRALVMLGRESEAQLILEKILKSPSLSLDEVMEGKYLKAEALYGQGEFEYAMVLFQECYNNRPDLEKYKIGVERSKEAILGALGNPEEIKLDIRSTVENSLKRDFSGRKSSNRNKNYPCHIDKDINFLEETLDTHYKDENMEDRIQSCLEFLDSKKQFWAEQQPAYTRFPENKISKDRWENNLLTPSFSAEIIHILARKILNTSSINLSELKSNPAFEKLIRIRDTLKKQKNSKVLISTIRILFECYRRAGDFESAAKCCYELCRLYKTSSLKNKYDLELKSRLDAAKANENLGKFVDSIKWLVSARKMIEDDNKVKSIIIYNIALQLEKIGKFKEALKEADSAIRYASLCRNKGIIDDSRNLKMGIMKNIAVNN